MQEGPNYMPKREIGEILDEILELLKDRERHELWEIAEKIRLSEENAIKALDILAEYGWIEYNPEEKRAKITPSGLELLKLPRA